MKKSKYWLLPVIFGAFLLSAQIAIAAEVYVSETIQQNAAPRWGIATTSLVRDAVTAGGANTLTQSETAADYVLQPKLLGLGEEYVLTIEKRKGNEVVLAKQVRLANLDELDKAASRATREVMTGESSIKSATTTTSEIETNNPLDNTSALDEWDRGASPVYDYWTAGVGPFGGNNLGTENVLYSFSLGHTWDIHPRASIKALGEAAFSTGDEDANLFNLAVGPSYYFLGGNAARSPYASLDFGYGFGQADNENDLDGFSLGAGLGYRFFRTATTGMEINLRWATIFDPAVGNDNPQIIGARLGVDF